MQYNKIKKTDGYLDWCLVGINCLPKHVI